MRDKNIDRIKKVLKKRKTHLTRYAEEYYKVLAKNRIVFATDHKDSILITRLPMGRTKVELFEPGIEETGPYFQKVYHLEMTKEIRIYGLNGKDRFVVTGEGDRPILPRLIGGDGEDDYVIRNGIRVRIYDFHDQSVNVKQAKKASVRLSRNYGLNRYDYRKPAFNDFYYYPLAGYNPDNGLKLGMHFSYTFNGFVQKPYTSTHELSAHYYFATHGVELDYWGIFANLLGKWKLRLDVYFTSPTFSVNFFGFGNNTPNYEKELVWTTTGCVYKP